MPSLLKERPTGRLGRLISALRPARAGPLPVQTGFPTSLADLFVKNHGRLKKPSSYASATCRRKRRGAPTLASQPPSPAPSPPPPSPPPSPPPAAVCPPPAQPRPELPRVEPVCRPGGRAAGLGLGFLALVGVVSLALLVIWTRKVVAAVTVAAFSLFLLESVRPSWLDRRPRSPATKEVDFDGRGYVSPIREVETESEPPGSSFSDSGRGIHVSNLDIEERIEEGDDSCRWTAKPKKRSRWKKLIPRKLQKGRIGKGPDSLSSSFRSESSQADSMLGGNATPDSRRGRRNHQADAKADSVPKSPDSSGPLRDGVDAEVRNNGAPIEVLETAGVDGIGGGGGGSRRFPFVAVTVVVLVGLVAGRLPAIALTVVCSALVSKVQRLWLDGGVNSGGEAISSGFHRVGGACGSRLM